MQRLMYYFFELLAVRNPCTFNYKLKLSLNRPGETLRFPGVSGPQISR
jgi:hypothetical protein